MEAELGVDKLNAQYTIYPTYGQSLHDLNSVVSHCIPSALMSKFSRSNVNNSFKWE